MRKTSYEKDYGGEECLTPMQVAEKRIEIWKRGNPSEILDLGNLKLSEFPESLRTLQNIPYINLSDNYIK
jgi:hypothetical protein